MQTEIAITEFKTHCLNLINKLQHSKHSIIITKHDKPVAKLMPLHNKTKIAVAGSLKGKAKIVGDIVSPTKAKWHCEE